MVNIIRLNRHLYNKIVTAIEPFNAPKRAIKKVKKSKHLLDDTANMVNWYHIYALHDLVVFFNKKHAYYSGSNIVFTTSQEMANAMRYPVTTPTIIRYLKRLQKANVITFSYLPKRQQYKIEFIFLN